MAISKVNIRNDKVEKVTYLYQYQVLVTNKEHDSTDIS